MQVRFTARGNFKPLEASLRGLNTQMARSMGGAHQAAVRVQSPINDLNKAVNKGRLGWKQYSNAMRNQSKILREHNALMNSGASFYKDAAGNARVFLDVNRNMTSNLATLGQRLKFTNTMLHAFGRNMISVGKNMQWAGRQVMVGLTIPLGLLAGAAERTAREYDKNVTRIIKVNDEASQAQLHGQAAFEAVSESIRRQSAQLTDLGASMGFMADETTDLVATFSQMGFVGAQLDALSDAALRLSRTSGTDLNTSIELTRLTAQAFGVELDQLNQKFANLNIVENNTALGLEELANAMPVVAGVASTLGLEIEQTAGLLALMKENGIGAREGATALRTGLTRIVQEPTDPAIEAFETINMNLLAMRERMQTVGEGNTMFFLDELSVKLQELAEGSEANQAQLNNFIGAIGKLVGIRQAPRFISMLKDVANRSQEGTAAHRAFLGAIQDAEENLRVYESELEQVQKSQAGMAEQLKAEMNVQLVRLGENFLEVGNMIRRSIRDVLKWFNNLDDKVQNTVFIVGGLAAALGPITMLLGIMTNAIGQVITVLTKFLPRISIATIHERALAAAYGDATNAINLETAALERNMAAKGQAAAASRGLAGAQASAVGAGGGTTMSRGAVRKQTAKSVAAGTSQRVPGVGGAMLGGAIFAERFKASIGNFIKNFGSRLKTATVGLVASLVTLLKAGFAKIVSGLIAAKSLGGVAGGTAAGLLGAGKAVGAVGGGVAGVAAGAPAAIIAAVTAIASVPILSDPQGFMRSFSDAIAPALERFKNIFDPIREQVTRIMELFRTGGEEGSGLAKMAGWIGKIAGFLGSVVLSALTRIVELVAGTLGPAFEAIFHVVDAIASAISGDWPAAGNAMLEMLKAVGRALMNILTSFIRFGADIVEALPGMEGLENRIRAVADGMDDWHILQSDIKTATKETVEAVKDIESAVEKNNNKIEEGKKIRKSMIEAELIGAGKIQHITEQQILNNEKITGEQKKQLILLKRRVALKAKLEAFESRMKQLREMETSENKPTTREGFVSERRLEVREEMNKVIEEMKNLESDVATVVESVSDGVEDSVQAQQDFTQETKDTTSEQEKLEKKIEDIEEKIKKSEEAAKEWAQQLRTGVSEVIGSIADAVMSALEAQERQMHEQFENRKERAERIAERELKRIDDIVAAEEEQEKKRQEWFEAQKARIEYLENLRKKGVKIQESLARGDLEQAALIRIEMRADEERFMMDSLERQQEERQDKRQKEIADMKEAVEKQKQATMDQLEVELEAAQKAYDARKRSIELYLRDWKEVTPATEAEFRRHLSKLETNMSQFGVRMHQIGQHYTNATGRTITNGFQSAINRAKRRIARDNKWKRVGRSVGSKFRAGLNRELNKLKRDLDKLMSGSNVRVNTGSGRVGSNWSAPSQSGVPKGVTKGSTYSGTQGTSGSGGSTSSNYMRRTRRGGIQEFHTGGKVSKTKPDMPMLKQDEQSFVLQRGEFVVQKDAVNALGTEYLQRLNEIKRHSGGIIDFSGAKLREAGALRSAAGMPMGGASSLAALKMIELSGADAKIKRKFKRQAAAKNVGRKAGDQIRDVFNEFLAYGPTGGPGKAGPQSSASGDWPPRSWGKVSPNTAAALNFIMANDWGTRVSAFAGANRGDPRSDHSWGKAIDSMITTPGTYPNADERQTGWRIANWFLANADAFGTKYVIWDGLIKNPSESSWRKYTRYGSNPGPTLGHFDHPHVSFMHDGGLVGLKDGGKIKFDNTIANLHKGERVLTEPSTKALETAIQEFARHGGGGNSYHLEVKVSGGNMDEKKLTDEIMKRIDKKEMAKGRKRVVKGNA